jgi:hypothetical protein
MDVVKKELINTIIAILTDLIPGGKYATRSMQTVVTSLLPSRDKNIIPQIADRIFNQLYDSVGLDDRNPGAAKSAAHDTLETIRKANLTLQIIVDCCLDSQLLFKHVMQYPADGINLASSIRTDLYERGVRAFCDELIANVSEIKSFQVLVYQKILLNQRRIIQMLEEEQH